MNTTIRTAGVRLGLATAMLSISTLALAEKLELKTDMQKASYAIGQQIAAGIKRQGVDVDVETLKTSLVDGLNGKESALTPQEMQKAMLSLQSQMQEKQKALATKNKKAGEDFLKANKSKKGVKTTKSGLQYTITKEGSGKSPKPTDTVKVHYKGSLIDGTEFDSSYKRNAPAEFPLNGVIPGWTEGIPLMKTGGKATLFVPSALAYGEAGRPGIPPNSVLVFDVELLEIK